MKASEILARAADLIEPEGRWTRGDYAKDANGNGLYGDEPGAVCWCALGALQAIRGNHNFDDREPGKFLATVVAHPAGVQTWNDATKRTQAEVVAKLREAAALAAAEGQ